MLSSDENDFSKAAANVLTLFVIMLPDGKDKIKVLKSVYEIFCSYYNKKKKHRHINKTF